MTLIFMADFSMPTNTDSPNDATTFDPVEAATSIQGLADLAHRYVSTGLALPKDVAENGIRELYRAQVWLDARLAELSVHHHHRPLVAKDDDATTIVNHAFVYVLRYAARELVRVHKLLDARASAATR